MNTNSQKMRIFKLLDKERGNKVGGWVPLYRIMDLKPRIGKYTNRISDLRQDGWVIENRKATINGHALSWYRLENK